MKKILLGLAVGIIINYGCNHGQTAPSTGKTSEQNKKENTIVGEGCDGCELMYIGMPAVINSIDTSPAWNEKGQRLLVEGTVYRSDEKTPASGIIIYYHHTDNNGFYSPFPEQHQRSKRHGHIRGWVKTDSHGNYAVYTIKPAPYPGRTIPAHIHITIKEPSINEYYIDDINFDEDEILTEQMRQHMEKRGGSGIVQLTKNDDGLLVCKRDIILGKNIPNYK